MFNYKIIIKKIVNPYQFLEKLPLSKCPGPRTNKNSHFFVVYLSNAKLVKLSNRRHSEGEEVM